MAHRRTLRVAFCLLLFVMQAAKQENEALKQEIEAVKRQNAEQVSSHATPEHFFSWRLRFINSFFLCQQAASEVTVEELQSK